VDGEAAERRQDVAAAERAFLSEQFEFALEHEALVGKFAPPFGRIGEQCSDPAVDIDEVIGLRRAGVEGQPVEFRFVRFDIQGQRLEHGRSIVEGRAAQVPAADGFCEAHHRAEVEPAA
jgi:hypothetical protein